jgi:hypothetical protein
MPGSTSLVDILLTESYMQQEAELEMARQLLILWNIPIQHLIAGHTGLSLHHLRKLSYSMQLSSNFFYHRTGIITHMTIGRLTGLQIDEVQCSPKAWIGGLWKCL